MIVQFSHTYEVFCYIKNDSNVDLVTFELNLTLFKEKEKKWGSELLEKCQHYIQSTQQITNLL